MRKRVISLFLAVIFIIAFAVGCSEKKTDEELIEERIETFVEAYNTGDFDGVLESLDAKTRNTVKALFSVSGGIIGGLSGFSFELSDLFSLGVALYDGEFLQVEISQIELTSDTTAVAAGKMLMQGIPEDIYFYMLKEDEDWFIQDMTDELVIVKGDNGGSDNNSNNGDNNSNGGDNNSNGGDNNNSDDSGNNSDDGALSTYINLRHEFTDGRAWITYTKTNDSYVQYKGFIDENGNVLYRILNNSYTTVYNIGNGCGLTKNGDEWTFINADGETKVLTNAFDEVKVYGGGYVFVYKYESSISSVKHLYGMLDGDGNWIMPLFESESNLWDDLTYIGGGVFADCYYANCDLYNARDGGIVAHIEGGFDVDFDNGIAYVTPDSSCNLNSDAILWEDGVTVSSPFYVDVTSEFSWGYMTSAGYKWYGDGKIVLNDGEYIEIMNYWANTGVQFTEYPSSMVRKVEWSGGYGAVTLYGADGNYYFTVIDSSANQLFEPIKMDNSYELVHLCADGGVFFKSGGYLYRADKDGNTSKLNYKTIRFNGTIGIAQTASLDYCYVNEKGEKLFTSLTEKVQDNAGNVEVII